MKLLPHRTDIPNTRQVPVHVPKPGRYPTYRDCVRWDFGFTCPFCLLHEADLSPHGAEREAMVWIEHRELRSQQPDRADDYMNCLFSCRFCNGRRTTKPVVDEKGRTLLDPRKVAWADRFEWDGIYLIPKSGDADAEYTYEAYRIDDDKRTGRRKWRDKRIPWLLRVFRAAPDRIRQHQHQAELYGRKNQTSRALKALQRAREWQEALEVVTDELRTFSAVPDDAPAHCRCDDPSPFRLPDWLDRQTIEIDL